MSRAVYTIGEKKGRGFGEMHPREWILEYPRKVIKQEVQKKLAARANGFEEGIGQKLKEERKKVREIKTGPRWTYPKEEDGGKEVEIISEQLSENEMEVTEQTEENDWTVVSHKSAARRNNTNKTERKGETDGNRRSTENDKKKK